MRKYAAPGLAILAVLLLSGCSTHYSTLSYDEFQEDYDVRTGRIDAALDLGAELDWAGVLQIVQTSYENADNNAEIKSDQSWGQTFSHTSGSGTFTATGVPSGVTRRTRVSTVHDTPNPRVRVTSSQGA